jgi:hypothetical protein
MSLPSPKEFYERYRDNPNSGREDAYKIGQKLGQTLLINIQSPKQDLETVVKLLNEFQKSVQGSPTAKIQDEKIVMECSGFCPIMRAALSMSLPWLWLDENFAIPLIEGIVSTKMPDLKLDLIKAKSRGDSTCLYVFE